MSQLKQHLEYDPSVVFVDEPVELWEEYGLLQAMYSGAISRTAFQLMVLNTRCAWMAKAIAQPGVRVVVCERSIWSDKVCEPNADRAPFRVPRALAWRPHLTPYRAQTLDQAIFADVNITERAERAAYQCAFEALCGIIPQVDHATVLLDAPLEVIFGRVQKRARAAETAQGDAGEEAQPKGGIDEAYLSELQQSHYAYFEVRI